jgi:putative oxidoreductase
MDFGFLMLRMTVGLTLVAHGAQKVFGWFGGSGVVVTGQRLAMLGFHRPALRAPGRMG